MDILHGGAALPDATPTGGPGTTVLDLRDGGGLTWTMTRVAGKVVAIPSVAGLIPANGASGQVVGYGGSPGTGAWVMPPGTEIGYDAITGQVAVASTSQAAPTTVLTASAHTFDGGAVIAEIFCPSIQLPSASLAQFHIGLYESTTSIGVFATLENPAAAVCNMSYQGSLRFSPTAGSHTYSIGCWVSVTTGAPTFFAGASGSGLTPAYLRFTKV